jgi:glycosyltransferase involved in cell wall biosynthesis
VLTLPKISVVTPCFNSIATIKETIESVRQQGYPAFEHIVFDGGSTDGTVELLRQYSHLIWVSERDSGHYHAMNKGIERATGEVVAVLNADDCYRHGALGKVGAAFATHPEWDGLFGDVVFVDGEKREIYRREEAVFDYDVLRFGGVGYVIHPTLFVKKSVYTKLGAFRYKELKNCADYDFVLRLGQERCRIGHLPELIVDYRWHALGQSADVRIQQNMLRESALILREHGVPPGWRGKVLRVLARGRRQFQKLRHRGRCDIVPGKWKLRKHMHEKTTFSSNIGLDKL